MEITEIAGRDFGKHLQSIYSGFDKWLLNYLQTTPQPTECGSGCFYCCRIIVRTTVIEISCIADFIDGMPSDAKETIGVSLARFKEEVEKRGPITILAQQNPEIASLGNLYPLFCPFLHMGRCSIYEVRPFVCRFHISESAAICEADKHEPQAINSRKMNYALNKTRRLIYALNLKLCKYLVSRGIRFPDSKSPICQFNTNLLFEKGIVSIGIENGQAFRLIAGE